MQVAAQPVAVGHQAEVAVRGRDVALVHAFDGVFGFQAVADEVFDRADLQAVFGGELLQLGAARHRTVGVEDFHQHAGGLQAGQQGQVAGRFGVAAAGEHAAGLGHQRENVAGLGQVVGGGVRAHGGADGMRAVVGADAGGHAFGGFDADGEVGLVGRVVVAHHRAQAQLPAAFAGERKADQAARVGDHEVDVGGFHQLGGHDQVAFVFAVLVVHHHDHAALADFFKQFGDGGETHADSSRAASSRST